ncbi:MAG TPA: response regulator [Pyrinomonadaceae bacterium]|nr:response regulator [Pyrinomonadaceae bacterium]
MGKHRILVIEDQEDLAELYESSLNKAGYEVTNAYTGEEGVAEFEANGADAVLLDMTLPEMHGTKVLEEIRNLSASVPVVVVTGETLAESRQVCDRLGVQDYLAKPPELDSLLKAFERALSSPAADGQYLVVTMRLPVHVLQILTQVDPNLERAITRICDECGVHVKAMSAKQ